ncbi:MAG: ribosome silencing factor [Planctomycetes bacterium]|nr:ribosome silencing factor [Planctomycetota bacterium]
MTETPTQRDGAASLRDFAIESARLLHDRNCEDIILLDVRDLSQVCDYVLLGSGTSDRQMKSVADELEDIGSERGHACFRKSRDVASTWIVNDFVDLVTHIFEPGQRAYYDLEGLWSDAATVEWRREAEPAGS